MVPTKFVPYVVCLLALSAIYLYSMYAMPLPFKLLYLVIGALAVQGVLLEMGELGCTFEDCSDETVYAKLRTDDLACTESRRVNWRRVLVVNFIVLVFMNLVNPANVPINFVMFLLAFTFWYFYTGFDAYHRFRVLCEHGRTCYRSPRSSGNEFQRSTPAGSP